MISIDLYANPPQTNEQPDALVKALTTRSWIFLSYLFIYFFGGALPVAYEGSQARGLIGAVASSLHHSYSNTGSKPSL